MSVVASDAVITLHPTVRELLKKRDIEHVDAFLDPSYEDRPDPFLMSDMEKGVERILRAISDGESIAAWTDYDCDGIPAGALLSDFFHMIEYPLRSYIPERAEGYALNKKGIETLHQEGVSLLITADCGITSVEEVAYAQSLGIDVIVTDHHLPQAVLPPAHAVINPHRSDDQYPSKELCGTGVAFKLVEGLLARGDFKVPEGQEKWLLDLVALATVADMVPLVSENRTLVRFGLLVMRKGRRKGLRELLKKMRVSEKTLTEDDIAFSIAPKINASSRMESPLLGLELLTTTDDARARELGAQLVKLNDARKLEGARVAKEVKKRLAGGVHSRVVVMGHSTWNPALLGIAATGIVETYQRTVCLWGKDGDLIKGSCRSDGTVNIVSLMASAEELFEDFGGHELSGGFSLKSDAIHKLPEALEQGYGALKTDKQSGETREADSTISIGEVNSALYKSLRALAPFGVGNPKPLFSIPQARVEKILFFGKHKEHVRISFSDGHGKTVDGIAFFFERTPFKHELELLSSGDTVSVLGSVEESSFGGRTELRLRLESLALARGTIE